MLSLRLYANAVVALPQVGAALGQEGPYAYQLNCMLQLDSLPEEYGLEVSVNNERKQGRRDGSRTLFSWILRSHTDEILLRVTVGGSEIAFWRGTWDHDALFHLGTLPVQIFYNGMAQPLCASSHILGAAASPLNGHAPIEKTPAFSPTTETGAGFSNDDEETEDEGDEAMETEWEEEEDAFAYDDEEAEENDDDQGQMEAEASIPDAPLMAEHERNIQVAFESGNPVLPSSGANALVQVSEGAEQSSTSVASRVATFHASSALPEQSLQALKDLLAAMPRKTVIVDLNEQPRSRSKQQPYRPFSQAYLRDTFGGIYWDRSPFISTVLRTDPATTTGAVRRWRRIVTNAEHPASIPYLEKYLREGYSMILMDRWAIYTESVRCAVAEALQQRLPGLELGPLH